MAPDEQGRFRRSGTKGAWDVLSKALLLRENEFFLDAWTANFEQIQDFTQFNDGYQTERATGLLALTNKRLLFVAPRSDYPVAAFNPFNPKPPMDQRFIKASSGCNADKARERYCIWESLDLEDVESFRLRKARMSDNLMLYVRWWHRGHPHSIIFCYLLDLSSFDEDFTWAPGNPKRSNAKQADKTALRSVLTEAMHDRWEVVAGAIAKNRGPIVVDFSTLREILKAEGISLESIKCPSCGGTISLPTAGAKKTCEYCGSHIYAMQMLPG